jgi:hypothetical protein
MMDICGEKLENDKVRECTYELVSFFEVSVIISFLSVLFT